MANITIRNLPEETKAVLRVDAAKAGVSLEAYVREILNNASIHEAKKELHAADAANMFFGENGVNLNLPSRDSKRQFMELDS